jgi:hypothetical protein
MEQFKNKLHHGNTLEYWKNNAEEDYSLVPISVLKYITVLEEALKDSWNREEVITLITKCINDRGDYMTKEWLKSSNWIEENL